MDIVAQEFKTPGNIGALARVMKNFGFKDLVLLNPKCNHLEDEAIHRSTNARDVLESAKVVDKLNYDTIIGTSSIVGMTYSPRRCAISPEELSKMDLKGKVALMIGREGDGMSNEDLEMCDIIVCIPSSKDYSALNVSHAAGIIMYELFKTSENRVGNDTSYASREEKDSFMKLLDEKLNEMDFIDEEKKNTQRTVWKKLIGKRNLTKREITILFGFMKKIK
ncbi:RNA methyltransferase [archaeon]|nr:RNA methyltransferase [archaeon]MBT3730761.1 RNA methyltransferase [archaeon]MBT4669663.1 RNA methyltransferase [archaeon]MBT7052929.1 RNA methyltransferase [archaeon]MBT8009880.1 RNA methyltransferase [archaeon]